MTSTESFYPPCPECGGDIPAIVSYVYRKAERATWGDYGGTPPEPAGLEDVEVTADPCDCGCALTDAECAELAEKIRNNPSRYLPSSEN